MKPSNTVFALIGIFASVAACTAEADPTPSDPSGSDTANEALVHPTPTPTPTPPGGKADAGPPPRTCSGGGAGANANGVCSSDRNFFASAEASCASEHAVLTAFTADQKCGAGSSNSFTFSCCTAAPTGCTTGAFGNAKGICSTDDSLFASAEESCSSDKRTITAFTLESTCSASTAGGATYTCCK